MSQYLYGFDMSHYFSGQVEDLCTYYKEQGTPLSVGQVEIISGTTNSVLYEGVYSVIQDIKNNGLKLGYYAFLYPYASGYATVSQQAQVFVEAYNYIKDNLGYTPDLKIMIDIELGPFQELDVEPTCELVAQMVQEFVKTVNSELGEQEYIVYSSASFISSYFKDIDTTTYDLAVSAVAPIDSIPMTEISYPTSDYTPIGYSDYPNNWGDNWVACQFAFGADQDYDIFTEDALISSENETKKSVSTETISTCVLEAYSLFNYSSTFPAYFTNILIGNYSSSNDFSLITKNIRTGETTTIVSSISDVLSGSVTDITATTTTPSNVPIDVDSSTLWLTFTGTTIYPTVTAGVPDRTTNSGYEITSDFYSISIDGGKTFTPIWKQTRQSDAYYGIPNNGGGDAYQYWGGQPITTNGVYVNGSIGFSLANPDNLTELTINNPYYQWFVPQPNLTEGDSGFVFYTINVLAPCMELAMGYANNKYYTHKTYYEFDKITKYSHRLLNSYSTAFKFYGDIGSQFDTSMESGNYFTGSILSLAWLNVLVQYPYYPYESTSAYYYNSGDLKGMKFTPIMAIGKGGGATNPPEMCFVSGFTWNDGLSNNPSRLKLQKIPFDNSDYSTYYEGTWSNYPNNVPYWLIRGWKYNNGYNWTNMLSDGTSELATLPTSMAMNPQLNSDYSVIGDIQCGFYYQKNMFVNAVDTNYTTTDYSVDGWEDSPTMYLGYPNFLNQTLYVEPSPDQTDNEKYYSAKHLDAWSNYDGLNMLPFVLTNSSGDSLNYLKDLIFITGSTDTSTNTVTNEMSSYLDSLTGSVSFPKGYISHEALKSIFFESQLYNTTVSLNQSMYWNNLTTTVELSYSESSATSDQYNTSSYWVQNYNPVYASSDWGSSTIYGATYNDNTDSIDGSTAQNTSISSSTYISSPVYSVFGAIPIFAYLSDTITTSNTALLTGGQPTTDIGTNTVSFTIGDTPYLDDNGPTNNEESTDFGTSYYGYLFPSNGSITISTSITPAENKLADGIETYFYVDNSYITFTTGFVPYRFNNSNFTIESSYIGIAPASNIFTFPVSISTAATPDTSWALNITFPCSSTSDTLCVSGNPTYSSSDSSSGLNKFNGTYVWYNINDNVTSQSVPWGYLAQNASGDTVKEKTLSVDVYNSNPYCVYTNSNSSDGDYYNPWTTFPKLLDKLQDFYNISLQAIGGDLSIQPQVFSTPPVILNPDITSSASTEVSSATSINITNEVGYVPSAGELMLVTLGTQNCDGWRFDSASQIAIIQSGVKMITDMEWTSDNNYSANVGTISFELAGYPTIEQVQIEFTIPNFVDPFSYTFNQTDMDISGTTNTASFNIPIDLNYVINTIFKGYYDINTFSTNSLTAKSGLTVNYTELTATVYATCGDGKIYNMGNMQFNYIPDVLSYDIEITSPIDEEVVSIGITNNTGNYIYAYPMFSGDINTLNKNTYSANFNNLTTGYTGGVVEFNTLSSFTGADYSEFCTGSDMFSIMGIIKNGESSIFTFNRDNLTSTLIDNDTYYILVCVCSYGKTWIGEASDFDELSTNRMNVSIPCQYNNYYLPEAPNIIDPMGDIPFQTNIPFIVSFPKQIAPINNSLTNFRVAVDGKDTYTTANNDIQLWFAFEGNDYTSLGDLLESTKTSISTPITNYNQDMTISFSLLTTLEYGSHTFTMSVYSEELEQWSAESGVLSISIINPSDELDYQNSLSVPLSNGSLIDIYTSAREYLTQLSNSYSLGGYNFPDTSIGDPITFYSLWGCLVDAYNYNLAYNILNGSYSPSGLSDDVINEHTLIINEPTNEIISVTPIKTFLDKLQTF